MAPMAGRTSCKPLNHSKPPSRIFFSAILASPLSTLIDFDSFRVDKNSILLDGGGWIRLVLAFGTILRWQYGSELSQRCLGHACGAQNGTQELEWKAELAGKMTFLGNWVLFQKVF